MERGKGMKFKKMAAVVAGGALAASLALFGCSGGSNEQASEPAADESTGSYTLVKDGTLTVATSPDFPPFENLEGDEYVGFDIDLAKAIAEQLGVECEFTTIQFDGIVPAIQAGGQADEASPASPWIPSAPSPSTSPIRTTSPTSPSP